MEFLLVAILLLGSAAACFLPLKEKMLRTWFVVNALLTSLALGALAVPVFGGVSVSALQGFLVVDALRGLLLIPIAISWGAIVFAFALWWGACFERGIGSRQLFTLRSVTLVGGFGGVLLTLLANALPLVLFGVFITFMMTCIGTLYEAPDHMLQRLRKYTIGIGAAFAVFAFGIALLLVGGYQHTGELMLTSSEVRAGMTGSVPMLALLGMAMTGFSALWFLGLVPGMVWFREGVAELPKAQRLLMRVFLPVALFPHLLMLPAWGGNQGESFVQKMLIAFSLFSAGALIEYLRAKESTGEIVAILLLGIALASGGYGGAGFIPALMILIGYVLVGTIYILVQGGAWWSLRMKKYAILVLVGMPVLSPFFVPFVLSTGYGMQMMPLVATVTTLMLAYTLFTLSVRMMRAWTEAEVQYPEKWMVKLSALLLILMTAYGVWFLYADTLALMVNAVEATLT